MKNVVVVGSSNIDLIMRARHLPAMGETLRDGIFTSALGGKGANQAIAARRMGADVVFVTCLGDDEYALRLTETFQSEGMVLTYISKDMTLPTGIGMIVIDQLGQNTIVVAPGANSALTPEHIQKAQVPVQNADILLLQLEVPLQTVMTTVEMAAELGRRIVLNPAPAAELPDAIYPHLEVIIPNEIEAQMLTGCPVNTRDEMRHAAQFFLDRGVKNVVITLGQRGAFVVNSETAMHIPAFKVDPVDTTGAGDVFCGILAHFLADNMGLLEAVRWASAGAALSTTQYGAIPSIPGYARVATFLKENPEMNLINL